MPNSKPIPELPFSGGGHDELIVAYSGGADSQLLALIAADHCEKYPKATLTLFYLHHYSTTIEPERAAAFQWIEQYLSQKISGRFTWIRLQKDVDQIQKIWKKFSWEKTASLVRRRQLRLLYQRQCKAGKKVRVLLGHHCSDYEETLMLRRARNIPEKDMPIFSYFEPHTLYERPLFEYDRKSIRSFLQALKVTYFDDPDNYNWKRARNRLRNDAPDRKINESGLATLKWMPLPSSKTIPQEDPWEVVSFREIRMGYHEWQSYSPFKQRRLVFHAFKKLQITNFLSRSTYLRLHRLPMLIPPFACEREINQQGDFVVARRGLNFSLPEIVEAGKIRGDQLHTKHFIQQSYGRKQVKKIFSERKYSLRQKRCVILTIHPTKSDEVISIDTQYLQNTLDRPLSPCVQ